MQVCAACRQYNMIVDTTTVLIVLSGNQILNKVEKLYRRANRDYINSDEFISSVQDIVMRVRLHPDRMFVITKDLFNDIKAYRVKDDEPPAKCSISKVDISKDVATSCESTASESNERKPSARQLARLEEMLEAHHKEIQKYEEKELTLDDLDAEDNDYLIQERLKRRAAKIYKRLCELKGRSMAMGGTREKKFRYSGSRYNELNIHVQKFVNKHNLEERMPDYSDIRKIVKKCNEKYEYRLNKPRISDLAKEVNAIILLWQLNN